TLCSCTISFQRSTGAIRMTSAKAITNTRMPRKAKIRALRTGNSLMDGVRLFRLEHLLPVHRHFNRRFGGRGAGGREKEPGAVGRNGVVLVDSDFPRRETRALE